MTNTQTQPTHQAEGLTEVHINFLNYVATLNLLKTRLKGIDELFSVHIPQKEIETRFFVHPNYNRKNEIKMLIDKGYLLKSKEYNHNTNRYYDTYICLRLGTPVPSLVSYKIPILGLTRKFMLESLLHCELHENTISTDYFDFFLQHRKKYPHMFFKFDDFSERLHTPVTSFPSKSRKRLLLYGEPVASLDVAQMQPQILGKILKNIVGENEFSSWLDSGLDIYTLLADKSNLSTRKEGKDKYFKLAYGWPNNNLSDLFGNANWIEWINAYKRKPNKANPHWAKQHTNLAWLLQTHEVDLMKTVWMALKEANIPFLTVHDEIICRQQDKNAAASIFRKILAENFTNPKLNVSSL
jgi:hypothetical protein